MSTAVACDDLPHATARSARRACDDLPHGSTHRVVSQPPRKPLVKGDLSKIGINADIKTFPFAVRISKEGHRGEPYDLDLQAWGADYPDPVDFIDILLDGRNIQAENNNNNAYFNHAGFNKRMQAAGRISNLSKRYAAWALIDRDVMKQQAPLAPLFFRTVREFTSKRVGCWSYQPIYGAMNLNAVCIK